MWQRRLLIVVIIVSFTLCACITAGGLGLSVLSQYLVYRIGNEPNALLEANRLVGQYQVPEGYTALAVMVLDEPAILILPTEGNKKPRIRLSLTSRSMENTPILNEDTIIFARRKMSAEGYPITDVSPDLTRVPIRGERASLVVIDGFKENRPIYRWVYAIFPAPNGRRAAAEIYGPMQEWNQGLVDAFLASLQ